MHICDNRCFSENGHHSWPSPAKDECLCSQKLRGEKVWCPVHSSIRLNKYNVFMCVTTREGFSKVVEAESLEDAISQTSRELDNMDRGDSLEDCTYKKDGWKRTEVYDLFECPIVMKDCCYQLENIASKNGQKE